MSDNISVISSRQNPRVKLLCALSEKKWREQYSLFRFDGVKLCAEALDCGIEIDSIYLRDSSAPRILERLGSAAELPSEDKIIYLSDELFDRISEEKAPEGIITVAKHIDKFGKIGKIIKEDIPREESLLLIESVRDPGNLGTVIRSAAALGIEKIVMSADCADIYNPKTIRAAMGGLFRLDISRIEAGLMCEYIAELRGLGRRVFATALDDKALRLGDFEVSRGDCFVIGNEGHGLSSQVISSCDASVIIPMQAGAESLNAAMASVIVMWELYKANKDN